MSVLMTVHNCTTQCWPVDVECNSQNVYVTHPSVLLFLVVYLKHSFSQSTKESFYITLHSTAQNSYHNILSSSRPSDDVC